MHLTDAAKLGLAGSFQVYAMPIYDMLEYQMVKRNIPNGWISRLIYRTAYVVLVAFIAITIPFFGSLLGFIGEFHPDAFFPYLSAMIMRGPAPALASP